MCFSCYSTRSENDDALFQRNVALEKLQAVTRDPEGGSPQSQSRCSYAQTINRSHSSPSSSSLDNHHVTAVEYNHLTLLEQQGDLEESIWRIHTAILALLQNQCKVKHQKVKDTGDIKLQMRNDLRDGLVLKADKMARAALIFNIPFQTIQAHWEAAEHYGFNKTESRKASLKAFLDKNKVFSLQRLDLSQPSLLEVPKIDSDLKPGVPNYLVWVGSLEEKGSHCGCQRHVEKLKKMNGVQVFEVGNEPVNFRLSEAPKEGVLYVRHPNRPAFYIASSDYDRYLSRESVWNFVLFLNYLGATKVVFEKGVECSLGAELSAAINEGHVDLSATTKAEQSSSESTNIVVEIEKKPKGYTIPHDKIQRLPPYQRDPTWRELKKLRFQSSATVNFTLAQNTSGLNETKAAIKIMKLGFEGAHKKHRSSSNSINCQITFTPMKEYDSYNTVQLNEEGYEKLLNLDDAQEEARQFAIRYVSEKNLDVPPQNLARMEAGLEKTLHFKELLYLIYTNISSGPNGLMQVLEYQNSKVLNQYLVYALPEEVQQFNPQQVAIISEIVDNLLKLYLFVTSDHQAFYVQMPQAYKRRINQIFLNVTDDFSKDAIAFSREGNEILDLSLHPTQDTQWLMNGKWEAFFADFTSETVVEKSSSTKKTAVI